MKKEIQQIKEQMLKYLSHEERYTVRYARIKQEGQMDVIVLEQGKGVIDVWHRRKQNFIKSIISKDEIEAEKEKHKAELYQLSITYGSMFYHGIEVKSQLFKEVAIWQNFEGQFNEKSKVQILKFDRKTNEEYTELATVWTSDIFPKTNEFD